MSQKQILNIYFYTVLLENDESLSENIDLFKDQLN